MGRFRSKKFRCKFIAGRHELLEKSHHFSRKRGGGKFSGNSSISETTGFPKVEHIENYSKFSSLGEAGLESPGSTCPGAEASQVEPGALFNSAFDLVVETAEQVLYMWSLDAGEFRMPPNVSLAVGGNSTVQHLVLQVH